MKAQNTKMKEDKATKSRHESKWSHKAPKWKEIKQQKADMKANERSKIPIRKSYVVSFFLRHAYAVLAPSKFWLTRWHFLTTAYAKLTRHEVDHFWQPCHNGSLREDHFNFWSFMLNSRPTQIWRRKRWRWTRRSRQRWAGVQRKVREPAQWAERQISNVCLRKPYAKLTRKSQLIFATPKSIIVFLGNCSLTRPVSLKILTQPYETQALAYARP